MSKASLWPSLDDVIAAPTIRDKLRDAGGDLQRVTRGRVNYRVDSRLQEGSVMAMVHDCVLFVPKREDLEFAKCDMHLLKAIRSNCAHSSQSVALTHGKVSMFITKYSFCKRSK